jgi:hypothetical protein
LGGFRVKVVFLLLLTWFPFLGLVACTFQPCEFVIIQSSLVHLSSAIICKLFYLNSGPNFNEAVDHPLYVYVLFYVTISSLLWKFTIFLAPVTGQQRNTMMIMTTDNDDGDENIGKTNTALSLD